MVRANIDGGGIATITGIANTNTTGTFNAGVNLSYSTIVGSTLNVNGTGGGGSSLNQGIRVLGGSVTADTGAATFIGMALGTTTGNFNTGLHIQNASVGGVAATNFSGIGGGLTATSGNYNHGIYANAIVVVGAAPTVLTATKGFGAGSEDTEGNAFP